MGPPRSSSRSPSRFVALALALARWTLARHRRCGMLVGRCGAVVASRCVSACLCVRGPSSSPRSPPLLVTLALALALPRPAGRPSSRSRSPSRFVALALALAGGVALALAAARGDLRVGLFLVVPYVYGTGLLPFVGMALLIAAAVVAFLGAAERVAWEAPRDAGPDEAAAPVERRTRGGGLVLVGPVPIVWGSDRRVLPWMVGAGVALLALWLAVALLTRT